ncbi:MAG: hypothetical protein CMF01_00220 [Hyphomonas sp.]|nr:hypothetical protein [Hyphomonas sp.]
MKRGGKIRMIKKAVFAGMIALVPLGLVSCAPAAPASQEKAAKVEYKLAPAFGSILALDTANRKIEITHAPVAETDWPIMQMPFSVAHHVDMSGFAVGDPVEFVFDYTNDDVPEIVAIRRASAREVIEALIPESEDPFGSEPD